MQRAVSLTLFLLFVLSGCGNKKSEPDRSYSLFKPITTTSDTSGQKSEHEPMQASLQEHTPTSASHQTDQTQKKENDMQISKKRHKRPTKELRIAKNVKNVENTESSGRMTVSPDEKELDFIVQNRTGKKIYVTCFSYIKKEDFTRWHWDKSPVYELGKYEEALIDIDRIKDESDRKNVFGYLGVFMTRKEALEATYELTDDALKLDLDLLYALKHKKVIINVEQYGFKGEQLKEDITEAEKPVKKKKGEITSIPELDFTVENRTGQDIYLTCFIYQHRGDSSSWYFDKSPVLFLKNGQKTRIDVDTIAQSYERTYLRGFLGVFGADQREEAEAITYELLQPQNKMRLGALFALRGKKVVLHVEKYGIAGDIIDYTIKPLRRIVFGYRKKEPLTAREKARVSRLKAWR